MPASFFLVIRKIMLKNPHISDFKQALRENGYLIKSGSDRNMPTQRSMEMGLFEIKETAVAHSDGHTTVSKTPKVTGKGQQYFINKLIPKENAE